VVPVVQENRNSRAAVDQELYSVAADYSEAVVVAVASFVAEYSTIVVAFVADYSAFAVSFVPVRQCNFVPISNVRYPP